MFVANYEKYEVGCGWGEAKQDLFSEPPVFIAVCSNIDGVEGGL